MRAIIALTAALAILVASGCGGSANGEAEEQRATQARQVKQEAHRRAAHRRAVLAWRVQARERHQAARRRARLIALRKQRAHEAEERQREAKERERAAEREVEEANPEESECDPNYAGACLDPHASDYDCEGGSGNGPYYTGEVTVVGEDHYGLDANGNGIGCESE